MLSNSADRELGGAQHSFLCYPLARASVGETLELGMTQWLGAGGTSTHMLMFACCPGPPLGCHLECLHAGSRCCHFTEVRLGFLIVWWLDSMNEHLRESQWKPDHFLWPTLWSPGVWLLPFTLGQPTTYVDMNSGHRGHGEVSPSLSTARLSEDLQIQFKIITVHYFFLTKTMNWINIRFELVCSPLWVWT